jgi:hypothetical protein
MNANEPQDTVVTPTVGRFQYRLRTLLLHVLLLASSLAVFGAPGIVVFALVVSLAIHIHQGRSLWSGGFLALLTFWLFCLLLLLPVVEAPRESSRRSSCMNNLKQLTLALRYYHEVNGCFPPAYIADKNGRPIHSWRVLILPYLERTDLYNAYDFTQPWDGPNNQKLLASRPREYACPSDDNSYSPGAAETSYVAVVGQTAAWAGERPRKLGTADFPGCASNTIMLVEVADSGIPWTKPRDLSLDTLDEVQDKLPSPALAKRHLRPEEFFLTYGRAAGAHVAMADGSVDLLPGELLTKDVGKMLGIGGYPGLQQYLNWPNIAALAVWLLSVGAVMYDAMATRRKRAGLRPPAAEEGP